MSSKKTQKVEGAEATNLKASPMEFESVNLLPRIVAGGYGKSEADIEGLGPASEPVPDSEAR